jgi:hypothetical protein
LVSQKGTPAAGVELRLYQIGFGGKDSKLADTKSDNKGCFVFSFALPPSETLNLQVRAVDAKEHETAISATRYGATAAQTWNLVVPAALVPLASEFDRLAADLTKTIGGVEKLSSAEEGTTRRDLTFLNRTTGWDARLLAVAANSVALARATNLSQAAVYALVRVGLPSDPSQLARLPASVITQALTKANEAGIVNLTPADVTRAATVFNAFAGKARLTLTVPGTTSTVGDLLAQSELNADQQTKFAEAFFDPTGTSSLWDRIASLDLSDQQLSALKAQGKLAFLTLNNALLMQKLQKDFGSVADLTRMPEKDLHTAEAWKSYITALAPNGDSKALDNLIPPAYAGDSTTDRLNAYAGDLARRVRIALPTQVVTRLVSTGGIALPSKNASAVATLLGNASALGYELGRTPLNNFLTRNQEALQRGIDATAFADATTQLKTLHRLFQITPTNESLAAVVKLGFRSASDFATLERTDFLARFGSAFPSKTEAELVFRKAQQVHATVLNLHLAARQIDSGPALLGASPNANAREAAKAALVAQFPSLASVLPPKPATR